MHATRVAAEFPSNDKRLAGNSRRFTIHVIGYGQTPFPHAVAMWDWGSGTDDIFNFGENQLVEEFLFLANGKGERDGWLVGTTLNLRGKRTELHVLDAGNIRSGPLAT